MKSANGVVGGLVQATVLAPGVPVVAAFRHFCTESFMLDAIRGNCGGR